MNLIDRSLNYGRPLIRKFLQAAGPLVSVLDMGAGSRHELQIAQDLNPQTQLYSVGHSRAAGSIPPGRIRRGEFSSLSAFSGQSLGEAIFNFFVGYFLSLGEAENLQRRIFGIPQAQSL